MILNYTYLSTTAVRIELSFCLHWAEYFLFVLGEHHILITAGNIFQNKSSGIQQLLGLHILNCDTDFL